MRIGDTQAIVSIIVPCFNEEEAIGDVVRACFANGVDEALVVDGGSFDRTVECAKAAGARIIVERARGYGRACAAGVRAVRSDAQIIAFIDGDGSDVPAFMPAIVGPVMDGSADFVMGSRLRGQREPGSLTPQQVIAGHVAGLMMRLAYGVRFTDMSPFRAIRGDKLATLGMREQTYGWNLEMQMRVAARGLRCLEVAVDHRRRRGGVSKVSGNLTAGVVAAWTIMSTFVRLALQLRRKTSG